LSSCLGLKYLEDDEKLLVKNPEIKGIDSQYKNEALDLYQQRANNRVFGLPMIPQVYLNQYGQNKYDTAKYNSKIRKIEKKYNKKISRTDKEKKKDRLKSKKNQKTEKYIKKIDEGNWWMRTFEPIAIYDSSLHQKSVQYIEQFLHTRGYFRAKSNFEVFSKNKKKISAVYNVKMGEPYIIDSIYYSFEDSTIKPFLERNIEESNIIKGNIYNQNDIEKERERIFDLMANNGYYDFSKSNIYYRVDSVNLKGKRLIINQVIAKPEGKSGHKQYKIDSIIFTTETSTKVRSIFDVKYYNNAVYRFGKTKYKPKILDWRLAIRTDSLYSRKNTLLTQQQLSYLDAFKFVNINYDSTGTNLIANIFTNPLNRWQTSYEIGFIINTSQQLPGPFTNVGIKNRNTFHGVELTELSVNLSLQAFDYINSSENDNPGIYSLIQYGGTLSLIFPQIIFPKGPTLSRKLIEFNPRTRFAVNYTYENRRSEYERTISNASFSYLFQRNQGTLFNISPFNLGYTNVRYLSPEFRQFLDDQEALGNGSLKAAFQSSVITSISSEVVFNKNQYGFNHKNSSLFSLFAESGGTISSFLKDKQPPVIGIPDNLETFQWYKFRADYRDLDRININKAWAYRINIGIVNPYGENRAVPYEKRYFIGGSNSVRAWPIRRLGPGSFAIYRDDDIESSPIRQVDYSLEQGGDFILEGAIEYREKLIGFLDYALFIDFGNIWILNSNFEPTTGNGENGQFRFNSFYKEIAAGVGFGLRFDFSFLVFRLDGALQIIDPAQPEGSRFLLKNAQYLFPFDNRYKDIFSNKTSLNVGIGYPF